MDHDTQLPSIEIPTHMPAGYKGGSPSPVEQGPTQKEFDAACDVINKYCLRLYQLLWAAKLTEPGRANTKYKWDTGIGETPCCGIGHWLEAKGPDGVGVVSVRGKTPEEVYTKIVMIEAGKKEGRKRVSHRACCILATRRDCVCLESFNCPVHGTQCHGTHD